MGKLKKSGAADRVGLGYRGLLRWVAAVVALVGSGVGRLMGMKTGMATCVSGERHEVRRQSQTQDDGRGTAERGQENSSP